jgi:hypothetical protein
MHRESPGLGATSDLTREDQAQLSALEEARFDAGISRKTRTNETLSGCRQMVFSSERREVFMNEEPPEVVVVRTLRENQEATRELAQLQMEARQLGERLERLGKMLKSNPETVVFQGLSLGSDFSPVKLVSPNDLDAQRICLLAERCRELSAKIQATNRLLSVD